MQKHITINNKIYTEQTIDTLISQNDFCSYLTDLVAFLHEWWADTSTMLVQSSGSTGKPKQFYVEKQRMRASASMTCSFLGLKAKDSALLCMPLKFIGAKMVVVRSLEYHLNLIPVRPSSHPLQNCTIAPVFAAMTPAQVYTTLENAQESALLRNVRQLIIGGGAVEEPLLSQLHNFPYSVWSTYGMTETLSHIALKKLNGEDASDWYTPFSGVSLRLTTDGTLAITAPSICASELITNDIAEIDSQGRFRICGRRDNTINSGGIKIQIEELESQIASAVKIPFQITAMPDPHYGEIVVMLIEVAHTEQKVFIDEQCRKLLHPYICPKHIFAIPKLPYTESGKPARAEARTIAKHFAENSHN